MDLFIRTILLMLLYILDKNDIFFIPAMVYILGWYLFVIGIFNDVFNYVLAKNTLLEGIEDKGDF